jgi:hypothetical protein
MEPADSYDHKRSEKKLKKLNSLNIDQVISEEQGSLGSSLRRTPQFFLKKSGHNHIDFSQIKGHQVMSDLDADDPNASVIHAGSNNLLQFYSKFDEAEESKEIIEYRHKGSHPLSAIGSIDKLRDIVGKG